MVKPLRVTAGSGNASAGVWLRLRASPDRLLLPTVAHILFDRSRRLRLPVRVNGIKAEIAGAVPLAQNGAFSADAALLVVPPELIQSEFFPANGHLSRFCEGLEVRCIRRTGAEVRGRLVREGWSNHVAYAFGHRRLNHQWLVRTETGQGAANRARAGDSGAAWMTLDGVAVGLQVGIVRHSPQFAFLTPFETVCRLFDVAIAG